jgi:hypothetical protein
MPRSRLQSALPRSGSGNLTLRRRAFTGGGCHDRQAERGLRAEIEQVIAAGEKVVLVMRTPGVDQYRHRQADDRTYDVVTVRHGLIVGLHACRDHDEARALAGIS